MSAPTFPAPNHDHGRCTAEAIVHAEQVCRRRGQKLTPVRHRVLESLLATHRPLGAYEIIDALAARMPRPAPITVYRALEFLIAQGLVHRIESRNAYLACVRHHDQSTLTAFLICDRCGSVGELAAAEVASTLSDAAQSVGFKPRFSVVEIAGLCAHCRDRD